MFNIIDPQKNSYRLIKKFAKEGYDWWWHSLTAIDEETGAEKPFFFEYFLCNPEGGGWDKPVLGQHPDNKKAGRKPSYMMVKAGCWGEPHMQLHRFFPWKDVKLDKGVPFSVGAADCYACETEIRGSVSLTQEEVDAHPEYMCDAGSLSWNLEVDKQMAFNHGIGTNKFLCNRQALDMYWHVQGMKTKYKGTIILNGRKYRVEPDTCYGYADKNWGCDFTTPWVWLNSNHLVSRISGKKLENSAFDIGGGRPVILGHGLESNLLGALYYEGKEYEYCFVNIFDGVKTVFDCYETDDEIIWNVTQTNKRSKMETFIRCWKKDMLLVNYESPDGLKRHKRLWNGGNGTGRIQVYDKDGSGWKLVDDIDAFNIGCEYGEYDKETPYTKDAK